MQEHLEKDKDKQDKLGLIMEDERAVRKRLELTDDKLKKAEKDLQDSLRKQRDLEENMDALRSQLIECQERYKRCNE